MIYDAELTLKLVSTHHHYRVSISYFRVTLGHLKDGEGHFRVTMCHHRITIGHYFSFFKQT